MNGTLINDGDRERQITSDELAEHLQRVSAEWIIQTGARRVLLLPPDHTRLHSMAGEITAQLWKQLHKQVQVDIMPALGTHAAMTESAWQLMFGSGVPFEAMIAHRWREDLTAVGELSAEEMATWSAGRMTDAVAVEVNQRIVSGEYDQVLSIGQVVPHEVIGMANYTKNVCIGAGGQSLIHASHFLGAISNMESLMGRCENPVRTAVNTAYSRCVRPHMQVGFLLTVVEDVDGHGVLRGLFAGTDDDCFQQAGQLSAQLNITKLDRPLDKCVVFLEPEEFKSTWLGNKAIYRTRMAMADGGELIVLAPGVRMFGEDAQIDGLIRQHGYRGTPATLEAAQQDPSLASNLSAAAHLIHGSSEGRFKITYCPGEGLTRQEIEGVGFGYRPFGEAAAEFAPETCVEGWNGDKDRFYFIGNPGMGLWSTADRWS